MENRFNIYSTEHTHSLDVCRALAKGTKFPIVPPAPLLPGGVVMYGFLRGLLPTLNEAKRVHRPWVYVDRGYFRATYGDDRSGYFRVTRDALQHDGRGEYDNARWKSLGIELQRWGKKGHHILVCPPGEVFSQSIGGFSADQWLTSVLAKLKRCSGRPVLVRHKADAKLRPIAEDFENCHALITYMSNTAVEAVLAGVPVFCNGACAASLMGKFEITEIESPVYPERERWAAALAANQWTLDELRAGAANHLFGERPRRIQMLHGAPAYWCPVCDHPHWLDDRWKWNGDFDKPTFGPSSLGALSSFLSFVDVPAIGGKPAHRHTYCHVHIRDGMVNILPDSERFGGQTLPLKEWSL